jgi:polysaccharide export outer membrane protein
MFLRMPKISADYVLGEGDQLDVQVVGNNTLNGAMQSLTISNTGTITLPYLGAVQAAGLTAEGLESVIARLFKAKELVKNPQVLVYVTDYKANPIFIVGEVDNPGEYMMSQELTLLEAILMAGGIDPGAGSFAYLHRRSSPAVSRVEPARALANPAVGEPGIEITKVDLRPLKLGGVPDPDIVLRKGDVLVVPKTEDRRYYVLGDVRSPGTREIPQPAERSLSVSQAIAHAGGPTATAKLSDGLLVRYNEADGSRVEKKVDFMAILKGRQPDFEVLPNDIIFIPSSNSKSMAYGILGVLPGTMSQRAAEELRK